MKFILSVLKTTYKTIKSILIDFINNFEPTIILLCSAVGLSAIIQQVPFHYSLPLFIDAPLFIPVLSVMFIALLVTIYQWRMRYVYDIKRTN